jgi:hypothetical protein
MAAGDVADGISHRQHGKPEGQRNSHKSNPQIQWGRTLQGNELGSQNCTATPPKDQPKSSEQLGRTPLSYVHHLLRNNRESYLPAKIPLQSNDLGLDYRIRTLDSYHRTSKNDQAF